LGALPAWAALPLEYMKVMKTYQNNATLAYSIALIWGLKPTQKEFEYHLLELLSGVTLSGANKDALKGAAGVVRDEAMEKAAIAITKSVAPHLLSSIPGVGKAISVVVGAVSGGSDAKKFGNMAKEYYRSLSLDKMKADRAAQEAATTKRLADSKEAYDKTRTKVTGVSLDGVSGTVEINKTKQLKAIVSPSNATDKTVTWATSDAKVATVSNSGLVTAKGAGKATITVTTKDEQKKATYAVTVPAAPSAPTKSNPAPVANKRAEYQKVIQDKCKFGTPAGVWNAIDKNANPDSVYKKWAESYSKSYTKTRPSGQTDKQIIAARCGFSTAEANTLWDALGKALSDPNPMLKIWADSYYK